MEVWKPIHSLNDNKGIRGSSNQRFIFLSERLRDKASELTNGKRKLEIIFQGSEYTVIGFYKVNGNYMIYTDFTTDHTNKLGIKIYVDKEINNEYVPVSEEERKNIIIAFNKEVTSNRGN